MEWAHEQLGSNHVPSASMVPSEFELFDREILVSHLKLWNALRLRWVSDVGQPVRPVRCFQSAAQVLYNTLKGGVDGSTQYVEELSSSSHLHHTYDQRVALRGVKHAAINACILYRILEAMRDIERFEELTDSDKVKWSSSKKILCLLTDEESVSEFIIYLTCGYGSKRFARARNRALASPARRRICLFSKSEVQRVLDGAHKWRGGTIRRFFYYSRDGRYIRLERSYARLSRW